MATEPWTIPELWPDCQPVIVNPAARAARFTGVSAIPRKRPAYGREFIWLKIEQMFVFAPQS